MISKAERKIYSVHTDRTGPRTRYIITDNLTNSSITYIDETLAKIRKNELQVEANRAAVIWNDPRSRKPRSLENPQ
jgi:hypothetical protein